MEGPQFSSYAESTDLQGLGYDVIGMTACPEAKLAREAEITYAIVAMVTDYDCWHPEHDRRRGGGHHQGRGRQRRQGGAPRGSRSRAISPPSTSVPVGSDRALDSAFITAPEARDPELMRRLDAVAGRALARSSARSLTSVPKGPKPRLKQKLGQGEASERSVTVTTMAAGIAANAALMKERDELR
jgi:5'-methylthioadenosine phosphorylase